MSEETLASVWETEGMSKDDIKDAVEGNLAPKGKWLGQLAPVNFETDAQVVVSEKGEHPLEGKRVVRCHAVLQTDVGEKHIFFDAFPATVKATSKKGGTYIRQESLHAAYLYQGTELIGHPFEEVLEAAANAMLVYDIGIKKEREDPETGDIYRAENTLRGIRPFKEA